MKLLYIARTDTSVVGQWWWTVDRVLLATTLLLVIFGVIFLMAAGPAAAGRIDVAPLHFVRRQLVFLVMALLMMLSVSLLSPRWIRRIALLGFLGSLALMGVAPFGGMEIKGATRWIQVGSFSLQPSEFLKPTFAVVVGWMFTEGRLSASFPGFRIAVLLYAVSVCLLLIQPDFGQALVITAMWGVQFFLAGLPMFWVVCLGGIALAGTFGAYTFFPHVQSRIDRFLDPDGGDTYQVEKALQAFHNGGILGRGPGEGRIKEHLPDSHTDFIFAVAGEEFGFIVCVILVCLFAVLVLRAMGRAFYAQNLFSLIVVAGLAVQFGLQALINMASSLHMIPTKGMTMPFVSYGGSSLLSLAIGMGVVLSLTRRGIPSISGERV